MQSPVGGDILTFTILGFYKTRCDEWGLGLIEKLRTMQACVVSYKVAMAEGFIISKTGMFILKVHFNPSNSCWHASVLSWHCHIQEQNLKKRGRVKGAFVGFRKSVCKKKKKKKVKCEHPEWKRVLPACCSHRHRPSSANQICCNRAGKTQKLQNT